MTAADGRAGRVRHRAQPRRAGSASRSRRRTRCTTSRRSGRGATSAAPSWTGWTRRPCSRPTPSAFTADILLSMALWKAVADRHDLLLATGTPAGSARPSASGSPRWSGAGWTPASTRGWPVPPPAGVPGSGRAGGVAARGLPAVRRAGRVAAGAAVGSTRPTPTSPRGCARCAPQVERIRDLVGLEPAGARRERRPRCSHRLDGRVADVAARAQRGADVGGLLGPLEGEAARAERDLIVGAVQPPRATPATRPGPAPCATELEARGAALRDLAARCVAAGRTPRPGSPCRTSRRSAPCPHDARRRGRLPGPAGRRRTGHDAGQAAYAAALRTRDELRGRLEAYARQGGRHRRRASSATGAARRGPRRRRADLAELVRAATREVLDHAPADLARAEALLAAYQAYLGSGPRPAGRGRHPMSTTASACTQPGCTGHILDGYCDVCGSPPSLPPPLPRPARRRRARPRPRPHARDRRRRRPPGSATRPRPSPAPPTGWRPPPSARPGPRRGGTGHPAGRHLLDPAARRPARRRADHRPAGPRGRRRPRRS